MGYVHTKEIEYCVQDKEWKWNKVIFTYAKHKTMKG